MNQSFIANEIVSYWHAPRRKVIFKFNIEKAFDKISWDYLLFILVLKGLLDRWIHWIKACISFVSYSILINGKPKGYIQASKGITQGYPLSPFLFVIAMDYLSRLIDKAQQEGLIKGYIGQ